MKGSCHRCGGEVSSARIGVRDVCDRCGAYLHCCRNCEFFEPGLHNDCREPGAELVADQEQSNFCEFFHLGGGEAKSAPGGDQARAELERLFRRK